MLHSDKVVIESDVPNECVESAIAEDDIKKTLNVAVSGEDFERALKILYERMGYKVSLTPTTGDQGADLIVEKGESRGVIQAKYYSSPVGNSAVQEVVAAMPFYNAQKGLVITNSTFTSSARQLAKANGIQLIDGSGLEVIVNSLI